VTVEHATSGGDWHSIALFLRFVYLHKELSERVMSKEAIEVVFGTSFFCLRKARSTLRTTLSKNVECFSSRIVDTSCLHNGCKNAHAEADRGDVVVVEYNASP
jgi:hypothetical protein